MRSYLRPNPALLVALGWLALMVYMAYLPRLPRVPLIPRGAESQLGHFGTHAVLALLLYATAYRFGATPLRRLILAGAVMGVSLVVGTTLEFMQLYLVESRAFELQDILVNTVGAGAGVMAGMVMQTVGLRGHLLTGLASLPALVLGIGVVASVMAWNPAYPYIGDHWHSYYIVRICGETLDPFPGSPGGIHSHGGRLIHVHPFTPDEEGRNATLGRFFENAGGKLTASSITLPSGESYENGDTCPDGTAGRLHVTLFDRDRPLGEPQNHVIRERDGIYIQFGTPAPIEEFFDGSFIW